MSIRVRETRGTSWRDPRVPGTRHWHSRSVSMGAGWYVLGWLACVLWVWPLLVIIQFCALVISAVAVAAMIAAGRARMEDAYLDKSGSIWFADIWMHGDGEEVKPWLRRSSARRGSATPSCPSGSS